MTLLETLALLTLIITVIHGTVDITLQVLQYISKANMTKEIDRPASQTRAVNLF